VPAALMEDPRGTWETLVLFYLVVVLVCYLELQAVLMHTKWGLFG
jgi:hypothetical protein